MSKSRVVVQKIGRRGDKQNLSHGEMVCRAPHSDLLVSNLIQTLRRRSNDSKKYKINPGDYIFDYFLGLGKTIPRSGGVATLNPDSLETRLL